MSLISEALRRREEDSNEPEKRDGTADTPVPKPPDPPPVNPAPEPRADAPDESAGPPTPPVPTPASPALETTPEPPQAVPSPDDQPDVTTETDAEEEEKSGKEPAAMAVVVMVGGLLLLVGLAIWLCIFALSKVGVSDAVMRSTAPDAAGSAQTEPEQTQLPESVPPGEGSPVAATTPGPAATSGEAAQSDSVLESAQLKWPNLTLTGVVKERNGGVAIINGKLVAFNDEIKGVRLISVSKPGVQLEFQGEIRFLKVGGIIAR